MIRILVFIAVTVLVSAGADAQELHYGLKAGLNISDIALANFVNNDVESDYRPKAGFHGGVFVSADLVNQFAIEAELLYSNKGTRAGERINLHYITIPFLIRYELSEQFSLALGPEFGYLVKARSPLGDVSNTWNNKLDFGIDADVALKLTTNMLLALRYNAGFSSVIDTRRSSSTTGEAIKYQNRTLQLSLCFQLGEKMF